MTMNINGFMGVQFYDFEAYFAGDITGWMIDANYQTIGSQSGSMFSGNPSIRYDTEQDVTIVSGRANMPTFEQGTEAAILCMDEETASIFMSV